MQFFQTTNLANHKLILPHVKTNEGGLSSWQGDSAKKFPSPFINDKKGTRDYGFYYHTNKGVIWSTWIAYSKKLNIPLDGKKWLNLTNKTWENILKTMYWDSVSGDKINSQGIAEILFEAIWGGTSKPLFVYLQTFLREKNYDIKVDGVIGFETYTALNDYTKNNEKEIQLIKDLTKKRLEILKSLKGWNKAKIGWSRRLQEVEKRGIDFAKKYTKEIVENVKQNPNTTIVTLILVGVGAYLLKFGFPRINT